MFAHYLLPRRVAPPTPCDRHQQHGLARPTGHRRADLAQGGQLPVRHDVRPPAAPAPRGTLVTQTAVTASTRGCCASAHTTSVHTHRAQERGAEGDVLGVRRGGRLLHAAQPRHRPQPRLRLRAVPRGGGGRGRDEGLRRRRDRRVCTSAPRLCTPCTSAPLHPCTSALARRDLRVSIAQHARPPLPTGPERHRAGPPG